MQDPKKSPKIAIWFFLFFLAYSQPSQIGCLPYFRTWREFRMHVRNVLHAADWKYRPQKFAKIRHLRTIAQICWLYLRN